MGRGCGGLWSTVKSDRFVGTNAQKVLLESSSHFSGSATLATVSTNCCLTFLKDPVISDSERGGHQKTTHENLHGKRHGNCHGKRHGNRHGKRHGFLGMCEKREASAAKWGEEKWHGFPRNRHQKRWIWELIFIGFPTTFWPSFRVVLTSSFLLPPQPSSRSCNGTIIFDALSAEPDHFWRPKNGFARMLWSHLLTFKPFETNPKQ